MSYAGYDKYHTIRSNHTQQPTSSYYANNNATTGSLNGNGNVSDTSTNGYSNSNTRVRRKPAPPPFPYSSKYPHPDPTDPFAPLTVLREKAYSTRATSASPTNALDAGYPPTSAMISPTAGMGGGYAQQLHHQQQYYGAGNNGRQSPTADVVVYGGQHRATESPQPQIHQPKSTRPWFGLAGGYHSDSVKPSRPPKSRTRTEIETPPSQPFAFARQGPIAESTPRRERSAPPQQQQQVFSDSEYHYRRRSQSALVLPQTQQEQHQHQEQQQQQQQQSHSHSQTHHSQTQSQQAGGSGSGGGTSSKSGAPPRSSSRADASRQYTYDDRQSHGYMFNDLIDDVDDDLVRERDRNRNGYGNRRRYGHRVNDQDQQQLQPQRTTNTNLDASPKESRIGSPLIRTSPKMSSPSSSLEVEEGELEDRIHPDDDEVQSRHPTPPMTPDREGSLSTMSVSPREISIPGTAGSGGTGSTGGAVVGIGIGPGHGQAVGVATTRITSGSRRSGSHSPPLIGDVPPKALRKLKGKTVPVPVPRSTDHLLVESQLRPTQRQQEQERQRQPSPVIPRLLEATPIPKDTPATIHSADFPILRVRPKPESAPPSPLHPPNSLTHTSHISHPYAQPLSSNPSQTNYAHNHNNPITHSPMRHAESEPESMPMDHVRKKTSSFSSLKRRLGARGSFNAGGSSSTTGVRGKRISNPRPIPAHERKSSTGSDSSYEPLLAPIPPTSVSAAIASVGPTQSSSVSATRASSATVSNHVNAMSSSSATKGEQAQAEATRPSVSNFPKPKKSLSHVNLALKPLPNVSMGPSLAPSANPSMQGAVVPPPMVIPTEERNFDEFHPRLGLQYPPPSPMEFRPDPRRFLGPGRGPHSHSRQPSLPKCIPSLRPPKPEYESDVEDESAYTALLAIRELLTPEPVLRSLERFRDISPAYAVSPSVLTQATPEPLSALLPPPASLPPPSIPSIPTIPSPPPTSPLRPQKRLAPAKHRSDSPARDSRAISPTPPRPESPAVIRSKSPPPHSRAETAPPAVIDVSPAIPYRGPGPLPLTPPPRSKSPAQFQEKVQPSIQSVVRARSPTPPRQRPSSPHGSIGRSKRVVQEASEDEDVVVIAPTNDYLPVAQLRKQTPPMSRQTTNTTQSSSGRRPSIQQPTRESPNSNAASKRQEMRESNVGPLIEDEESDYPVAELRKPTQRQATPPVQSSSRRPSVQSAASGSNRDSPSRTRVRREEPPREEEVVIEPPTESSANQRRKPTQPPRTTSDRQTQTTATVQPSIRRPSALPSGRDTPSRQRVREEPVELESETDVETPYAPPPKLRKQPQTVGRQTSTVPTRVPPAAAQNVLPLKPSRPRARSPSPPPPPPPPPAARVRSPDFTRSPPSNRQIPETPEPTPARLSPSARRQRPDPPTPAFTAPSLDLTVHSHSQPFQPSGSRSLDYGPRTAGSFGSTRRGYSYPHIPFDEHALVTKEQLARAANLSVVAQSGIRMPFGDLFRDKKVIVCVIRHFWCHADQDYMYHVCKSVDTESLRRAGVELVIIGNGSHGMIKSYKNIFRSPFPIYTDPTNQLQAALGMTLRSNDPGPDSERGMYIRHGIVGGIAMVVRNALRVGMPVWEKGGDAHQLGGEFVFGPGNTCSFAHRMTTTRSHSPILNVVAAAGVQHYRIGTPARGRSGSDESSRTATQEDDGKWAQPHLSVSPQQSRQTTQRRREKQKIQRRAPSEEQWQRSRTPITGMTRGGRNNDDSIPARRSDERHEESDNASLYDHWGLTSTMKKYATSTVETDREDERLRPRSRRTHRKQQYRQQTHPRALHVANPDKTFNEPSGQRGRDAWETDDDEGEGSNGRYGRMKDSGLYYNS